MFKSKFLLPNFGKKDLKVQLKDFIFDFANRFACMHPIFDSWVLIHLGFHE